jgi:hypothetical protein
MNAGQSSSKPHVSNERTLGDMAPQCPESQVSVGAETDMVAVPTGARQPRKINDIARSLGKERIIDIQNVSRRVAQTRKGQPAARSDESRANMASPDPGAKGHGPSGEANRSAVPDKQGQGPGSVAARADGAVNGQPLAIDDLQGLSPHDREVVRESDEAFHWLQHPTWEHWKKVRAGLVVLRSLAMRETGSVSIRSKRYKNRMHELLEGRPYCSAKMSASTRKALLKCAELSPELDDWHAALDEDQRVRLNHPTTVLRAFQKTKDAKPASPRFRQPTRDAELETVRQEAAVAISSRDAQIREQERQIEELVKQVKPAPDSACDAAADTEETDHAGAEHPEHKEDADSARIVQYIVTMCGAVEEKIREVIDGLTAYLEECVS